MYLVGDLYSPHSSSSSLLSAISGFSGATFARSQDQKRHLREQAVCRNWYVPISLISLAVPPLMGVTSERAVGRNGASGVCSSCSPKRRRRGRSSCTFSDSNANANA